MIPVRTLLIAGPNAELTRNFYANKLEDHPGDAGMDIFPLVRSEMDVITTHAPFGQLWRIETGIAVHIPEGFFGVITGRSSTVSKLMGATLVQGIIDHGYVGPIYVMVKVPGEHGGERSYVLDLMERLREYTTSKQAIAQMLFIPYAQVNLEVVESMPETKRGVNGFGSTDKKLLDGSCYGRTP